MCQLCQCTSDGLGSAAEECSKVGHIAALSGLAPKISVTAEFLGSCTGVWNTDRPAYSQLERIYGLQFSGSRLKRLGMLPISVSTLFSLSL